MRYGRCVRERERGEYRVMNLMKQEKKGKFTLSSTSKKIFFSIFMMCLHGNKRKKRGGIKEVEQKPT